MATSGIHFGERVVFVRDWDIAQLIRAIGIECEEYLRIESSAGWILGACLAWIDDFDASAPGVRDLELDEALSGEKNKSIFVDYLRWLKMRAPGEEYDQQSVSGTIGKVLNILEAADT